MMTARPVRSCVALLRLSIILLTCWLTLSACTSAVKLRHPETGKTAKCGPYHVAPNMGFTAEMAMDRERRCVADYERQGFQRVP